MTRTTIYTGAGVVVLIALGLGYFAWQGHGKEGSQAADVAQGSAGESAQAATVVQSGTVPPPPPGTEIAVQPSGVHVDAAVIARSAPPPDGYVEYKNDKYGFSFYHTPQATVKEYDEGGGAMTVTEENYQKQRGFQVFIVPYTESKISEARFKEDVPSGVRKNVEKTSLDGVEAVTFNSMDQTLGQTREIWVIRGGYLYEITTFAGVGQWFTPIIQSWRFI